MSFRSAVVLVIAFGLATPVASWADPPAHAPARGYRNKHEKHHEHDPHHERAGGFEIVLDSELGIHVVIGLPGVFFHEGRFYRRVDGSWQVGARADGAWSPTAAGSVPHAVHRAHDHPGPAKAGHSK